MALLDAIARFAERFNQEEKNFGIVVLRAEERTLPEDLLLAGELRIFYARTEFDELIIGNSFFLEIASLKKLPRYQEGLGEEDAINLADNENNEDWQSNWLVFGDRNGDGIFAKVQDNKSPVFGSIQQTEEFHLASSLESFLDILTACMIMEKEVFNYEAKLEDYTVKPEFIEQTRLIVEKFESFKISNDFIDFFFG